MADAGPPDADGAATDRLWRHAPFMLFATSRASSVAASQMLTVSVGWTIYVRTGDPLDLGLVGLARFVPVLLLFLWAGIAADRHDRARIIAYSNIVQALASGLIAWWLIGGAQVLWPVFGLLFLFGAGQAFLMPAQQAILPGIVSRAQLPRAIAITGSLTKAAQLGGPALAGVLIAVTGDGVFLVVAAASVVAGISAALIRLERSTAAPAGAGLGAILGGFRHIRETPMVLGAITIDLVAVLFGGIVGLLPVFAVDILGVGPEALGLMRAMPAVGGLAMGLALGALPPPPRAGALFFLSLTVFGLSILVFSLSQVLWLSLIALAVYGAADMFSVYVRQTLIQLGTPDAVRGRVNAVNAVSINATNELGDFRAGVMAAVVGPVSAVAVGAAITLVATGAWWRLFPELRRVDRL